MTSYYGSDGHGMLRRGSLMFNPGDGGRARIAAVTRTWRDDRAAELRRRGYGVLMRIVFPRPLRIVCIIGQR
jgi:hypothetical protein